MTKCIQKQKGWLSMHKSLSVPLICGVDPWTAKSGSSSRGEGMFYLSAALHEVLSVH